MKLGNKLQKIAENLDLAAKTHSSLDSLLQFLSLSVCECLEDEFWMSLNSQSGLKMNMPGFPFYAKLKKETGFGFPKASTVELSFCLKWSISLPRICLLHRFLPILPLFDLFKLISSIFFQIRPITLKQT